MSDLNLWDHLFALCVFLIYPLYSKITHNSVLEDIRTRGERGRIHTYQTTILTMAVFAICIFAMWFAFDRKWAELGICNTDFIPLVVGLAIAAAVTLLIVIPLRNLSRSPERCSEFGKTVEDLVLLMPHSKAEESWFHCVSINAGVSEELIFRGYLIWYLGHFFDLLWAAAIALLLFVFAHLYQGLKQLPGILLVSAVAVSLYVYTGSLLVPILLHICLDAFQGRYLARILRLNASASQVAAT